MKGKYKKKKRLNRDNIKDDSEVSKDIKERDLLEIMIKRYPLFLIIIVLIFITVLVILPNIADSALWKSIQESTAALIKIFKDIAY